MRNVHLIAMWLVIVGIDVVVLAVWSGYDPLRSRRIQSSLSQYVFENECDSEFNTAFSAVLLVKEGVLCLIGSFLAFKTRNVHTLFSESKHLQQSIFLITVMCGIIVPVQYTIDAQPTIKFAIRVMLVIACVVITMAVLFLPKLYLVLFVPAGAYACFRPARAPTPDPLCFLFGFFFLFSCWRWRWH